jgi:8-oxo-dGTP diphosphatase
MESKAPRVIASAVIRKGDGILLVKEVLENGKEYWIFPGGGVEFGETISDAAKREINEELGLYIDIKELLGFKEAIAPKYGYHTVIFFFIAESLSEKITRDEKILDARYFTKEEIKDMTLVDSAKWAIGEMEKKGMLE